jgi:superfamily II DNA or RNA helicase
MLRDIEIKAVYNSEEDNILEDFYIPALQNSVYYDRAVGYFDAKMLTTAARGLSSFIQNDGYMRLIVGATLTAEEYAAIAQGYEARDALKRIERHLEQIIESDDSDLFKYQLNALTWLVKHRKLDVKVALRRYGIHHQKIGIMKDAAGDFVVFQGSANETNNALSPYNYETINVFKSWQPEFKEHFEPHMRSFNKLWENTARDTLVLDISDIAGRVLQSKFPNVMRPSIKDEIDFWQKDLDKVGLSSSSAILPAVPESLYGQPFKLKDHQRQALENWKNNNFRGVFELATGAGKTITSIYGAVKVFESRKKLLTVISVPYQALADQWEENLKLFNIKPVVCYGGEGSWYPTLMEQIILFQTGVLKFLAVVVVDATLSSKTRKFFDTIASVGSRFPDHFLFIGDECHHHGATSIALALPEDAGLRMGLSATPDRTGDEEGNEKIYNYYGDVIHKYTLADALCDKVLTPYEYHLVPVMLTVEETEKYIELTKKISRVVAFMHAGGGGGDQESALNILLNQRARVVNGTQNKPIALEKLLKQLSPIKHSLFYCAEGMLDDGSSEDDDAGMRQIEIISSLLHEYGWKSSQFTANEKKTQRENILKDFKEGIIDSLVAMKCLDEGVDIPACTTAFILSSSRKPRQFVQRRGRILRKSPGKEKAVIYDFFVTLPIDSIEEKDIARRLLIAELKRINEFASLALNKGQTFRVLEDYLKQYDLMHYLT